MADNDKILQLLALRKQLLDTGNPNNPTNLTSPEEYQKMPPQLQSLVSNEAMSNSAEKPGFVVGNDASIFPNMITGRGVQDPVNKSLIAQKMAQELQKQKTGDMIDTGYALQDYKDRSLIPQIEPERFAKIKALLKSNK